MIKVESLFYKIDQKLNKLSSNYHQSIPEEDKTLAVNEAILQLIKKKLSGNNAYRLGLDGFKKRYEDLELLIEDYKDHSLTLSLADEKLNKYTASLESLDPEYMFYIDSYVIASKGKCTNRIVYVNNDLTKHADVTVLINNNNYKPSFEFQETFSTISKDEIACYTDGSFVPTKIFLSYLRYPKYVHLEDFELPDGTILTGRQDCELPGYMEDEILEQTAINLASYIENLTALETSKMRAADVE